MMSTPRSTLRTSRPARLRVVPAARPRTALLPRAAAGVGPCETCGNVYDKAFEVIRGGSRHVFDCFECAITALAPTCVHCGGRIIGHGMEKRGRMFCCAHCASRAGVREMRDRA